MPVEDGLGQQSRGHAVADAEDRGPAAVELVEERVVGDALGDEDDAGRVQLERLAVRVLEREPARLDALEHGAGAHDDAALVQALAHEHVLERLGAERRDRGEARDELDLAALAGQQLGQRAGDEVAVAVVDDDPPRRRALAAEHDLLGREHVGRVASAPGSGARVKPLRPSAHHVRARRQHDRIGRVALDLHRGQLDLVDQLDVGQALERSHAVGRHATPLGNARAAG